MCHWIPPGGKSDAYWHSLTLVECLWRQNNGCQHGEVGGTFEEWQQWCESQAMFPMSRYSNCSHLSDASEFLDHVLPSSHLFWESNYHRIWISCSNCVCAKYTPPAQTMGFTLEGLLLIQQYFYSTTVLLSVSLELSWWNEDLTLTKKKNVTEEIQRLSVCCNICFKWMSKYASKFLIAILLTYSLLHLFVKLRGLPWQTGNVLNLRYGRKVSCW